MSAAFGDASRPSRSNVTQQQCTGADDSVGERVRRGLRYGAGTRGTMSKSVVKKNGIRSLVFAAVIAVGAVASVGGLLTYKLANASGIVVAQFLQSGLPTSSLQ
jgi:hypothetical protein